MKWLRSCIGELEQDNKWVIPALKHFRDVCSLYPEVRTCVLHPYWCTYILCICVLLFNIFHSCNCVLLWNSIPLVHFLSCFPSVHTSCLSMACTSYSDPHIHFLCKMPTVLTCTSCLAPLNTFPPCANMLTVLTCTSSSFTHISCFLC